MLEVFDPETDLAIVSQDSDFFCADVRYLPLDELLEPPPATKPDPHKLLLLYEPATTAQLLGLPSNARPLPMLHELSTLAGNDYSKPLLAQHERLLRQLRQPSATRVRGAARVQAVLRALRQRGGPLRLRRQLAKLATPPAMVAGARELLMALCRLDPAHRAGEQRNLPTALCKMLQTRRLSGGSLALLYRHQAMLPVVLELVDCADLCAWADMALPLKAAECLLLGLVDRPIRITHRRGAAVVTTSLVAAAQPIAKQLPATMHGLAFAVLPGEEASGRVARSGSPANQMGVLLRALLPPNSKLDPQSLVLLPAPAQAVVVYAASAIQLGRPLPSAVAVALLAAALLGGSEEAETARPPPASFRVSAVCATVLSHFLAMLSTLHSLGTLIGLPPDRAAPAQQLVHGCVFQHLCLGLLLRDADSPSVFLADTVLAAQAAAKTQLQPILPALGALPDNPPADAVRSFCIAAGVLHKLYLNCLPGNQPDPRAWAGALSTASARHLLLPLPMPLGATLGDFQEDTDASAAAANVAGVPSAPEVGAAAAEPPAYHQLSAAAAEAVAGPAKSDAPPSTDEPEDLPIMAFQEQILQHLREHRLTCIQADTGAGKSTRVPQMIYREACKQQQQREERSKGRRQGSHQRRRSARPCNIYITQPRRMAATSLARRVAAELKAPGRGPKAASEVGNLVG